MNDLTELPAGSAAQGGPALLLGSAAQVVAALAVAALLVALVVAARRGALDPALRRKLAAKAI
ncbi:MAG TPA: hypothetical protein VM422_06680, partial [Amaricoccus sp.]|nr:hypothetical protein [Amaricoccus sp.]